ncbi:MAG: cadherin-like domain-containing protein [Pseudomonadota bacterium]
MAIVSGEQKTWHKITVDFEAPQSFEETPSTFRDYRLDVTFRNADTGEVVTVPGFFAADGDAANSNATSGNIWRANFNPPSEGNWTYEASFRTGKDIAAKTYEEAPKAGSAVSFINGETGTIAVSPSDKGGEDFRAKGMILQDEGTHFLQHQGDGDYFVRGGPGVPENFLANKDFDNTANGRHDYATHLQDYDGDGPTWDGGKGKAIVGAVNYLAEQGQNTIYMLTNTSGGDGQDVSPWTFAAQNTPKFDQGIGNNEIDKFSTYDVSKLSQWELLFDHMDNKGIYKNVLLQETENDQQLDGGTNASGTSLSVERMVYMREMVARFGHNNGIQWNLGEENTNTNQQRKDMAEYMKSVDGYDHLVTIHSFPNQINQVYDPLLGVTAFDGTSFQTNRNNIRDRIEEFRDKSAANGDKWVLTWDEDASSNGKLEAGDNNFDAPNQRGQRDAFWGSLTAGGSGGNWYLKDDNAFSLDQNYDTFDQHKALWTWTAAATKFFNTYIPFWDMRQADGLTSDNDDYVMAKDGEYYVVYLPYGEAGDVKLNLNGQGGETFDVFWYNPRTGGDLIPDGSVNGGGVVQIGGAPSDGSKDWVLLVRNQDAPEFPGGQLSGDPTPPPDPDPDPTPPPTNEDPVYEMKNGRVVMQAESGIFLDPDNPENDTWELTQRFDGSKGDGVLLWTGNDFFGGNNAGKPQTAPLKYSFEIDEPGTYYISLRAIRPNTGEPGDRNNDFFVQFEDEGYEKVFFSGPRETFQFGRTYDIDDKKSPATFEVTQAMINENDGIFSLFVSARSRQAGLDEIHIQKDSVSLDNNAPTSSVISGTPDPVDPDPVDPDPGTNEAPEAKNDTARTAQNTTILVDVLANDTDADGNPLSLVDVQYDGSTSIVSIKNGQIEVNPLKAATNARTETITYTVSDGKGGTDTGVLQVAVGGNAQDPDPVPDPDPTPPANQAPVAKDDIVSTPHNKTISVDVLANDEDPNGDQLDLVEAFYDGNSSLVSIENGEIKVNPLKAVAEARTETITYTVSDGKGGTDTGTLQVNIGASAQDPIPDPDPKPPANQGPVANDDAVSTPYNRTIVVDVLANDDDPDGGKLELVEAFYDGNSSLVSIENGEIKVNPLKAVAEARTETITYTVKDEDGATDTATLEVNVGAAKPQPKPVKDSLFDVFVADAKTDQTLTSLSDGGTLNDADLGKNATFYVTAADDAPAISYVEVSFGGETSVERVEPYALFGDIKGDFKRGLDLDPGEYTLDLRAFGPGDVLLEESMITFQVV